MPTTPAAAAARPPVGCAEAKPAALLLDEAAAVPAEELTEAVEVEPFVVVVVADALATEALARLDADAMSELASLPMEDAPEDCCERIEDCPLAISELRLEPRDCPPDEATEATEAMSDVIDEAPDVTTDSTDLARDDASEPMDDAPEVASLKTDEAPEEATEAMEATSEVTEARPDEAAEPAECPKEEASEAMEESTLAGTLSMLEVMPMSEAIDCTTSGADCCLFSGCSGAAVTDAAAARKRRARALAYILVVLVE